jgi:hypothetical protein
MQVHIKLRKARTNEVAVTRPDSKEPETTYTVVTTLAFRNAVDELLRFAYAARSLGLASWGFGIVFAGAAVGLRFWKATDLAEPEFVSCIVFASLLVLGGYCLYVLESRGYVKLVSEFAVKKPDAVGDRPVAASGITGPEGPPKPAIAAKMDGVAAASAASTMTEQGAAPLEGAQPSDRDGE